MKKFKFKLDAVMRLRSHQKDLAVQELAEVLSRYTTLQNQINLLQAEISAARLQELPVHLGAQRDLFLQRLHVKMHHYQADLRSLELVLSEKRTAVAHAQSALRAVEKLKERQFAEWQTEFQRQEDRELAEVASRKTGGLMA